MKKRAMFVLATVTAMFIAGPAMAVSFQPFTKVTDVCPTCPKRATDTVTLNSSTKISAKVVAENDDFFVLFRYGEIRAVPKGSVQSVEWANGSAPAGLTSQDQIVLRNNHVLTGSIIEENTDRGFYRMQSSVNKQTFVVFANSAESVYKAGRKVK
ncbi:MAG: hypothetical protein VYE40_16335 [Myxococcota bacterium]|jgi:hypothetical protein|nr:hypothetical protein [Myxococcota bacterium]